MRRVDLGQTADLILTNHLIKTPVKNESQLTRFAELAHVFHIIKAKDTPFF